MIVYVYDKKENTKRDVIKEAINVFSVEGAFVVLTPTERAIIKKENTKIVIYGL